MNSTAAPPGAHPRPAPMVHESHALTGFRESARVPGRAIARLSGWFGFVSGAFSRTHRNLEVWRYRRSVPYFGDPSRCTMCGADRDALHHLTALGTSRDLTSLGEFRVVLCTNCAVARTAPVPGPDALVIDPDVAMPRSGLIQGALLRRFIRQRVRRVRPLVSAPGRPHVIDVGGGACGFANALADTGCDVTVFEPNGDNAAHAGPGVRFIPGAFDESAVAVAGLGDACADAVTMWHSLEHVRDPVATLALARRLLRPGGSIHVCVPNLDSLQADLFAGWWCYLDIPHHVSHFSPEGLARALHRAGFGSLRPVWWNEEYEVFGFYQSLLNSLTRSHNYYYNRAKRGRAGDAGPVPVWTRFATALGPLLLPIALGCSWWGAALAKPACAEISGVAEA